MLLEQPLLVLGKTLQYIYLNRKWFFIVTSETVFSSIIHLEPRVEIFQVL